MILEKYTSHWVKSFTNIQLKIAIVFDEMEYPIEHIGIAAVPNLDSKLIIDIDIIYSNPSDFEIKKLRLEKLGYVHHGNQGIEGREVFKKDRKIYAELKKLYVNDFIESIIAEEKMDTQQAIHKNNPHQN